MKTWWFLLAAAAATVAPRPWGEPFPGVVQDEHQVRGFVVAYRWLSNFHPCPVAYEGLRYGSSEAAYQAAKFPPGQREPFTHLDADHAKKRAHALTAETPAWNARKEQVMRDVVWAKFSQNPELAAKLLATGDRYLEETNWWADRYWGVFEGKGENRLGHILMDVRSRLAHARR